MPDFYSLMRTEDIYTTPEEYGALGNEALDFANDDMAAFQKAMNYLASVGGGTLLLRKTDYFLSQYTGAQVDNASTFYAMADATVSKCLTSAGNVKIVSTCGTTIHIEGGSSSPFGFSFSVNVLASCGTESLLEVTSADNDTRTVLLSDTTGLSVGKVVELCRRGQTDGSGYPYTPSQERAPQQFLTVESFVANTSVTFKEAFMHNFEAAADLRIYFPTGGRDYPRDFEMHGIKFKKRTTTGYVLISRVINAKMDNVEFEDTSFSFGMCQGMRIGNWRNRAVTETGTGAQMTIESCSDWAINSFAADGNGSANALGPLLITDNCRDWRIDHYCANRWTQAGAAIMAAHEEGRIEAMILRDCGTAAPANAFGAALIVGLPASGSYASKNAAYTTGMYKRRNLGNFRFSIGRLVIKGKVKVPVKVHDAEFDYDDAYIEHDNTEGTRAVFTVGQSGDTTADATHYPAGGQIAVRGRRTEIIGVGGTPTVLSADNGITGLFHDGMAELAAEAASGQNQIVLDDASVITESLPASLYHVSPTSNSNAAQVKTINSVSTNTLTLSANLTETLPVGTKVWFKRQPGAFGAKVDLGTVIVDGVVQ